MELSWIFYFFYHLSVISHSGEIQHTETLLGHQISPSASPLKADERCRYICDDWVDFLATRSEWYLNNINQIEVIFIFCYIINRIPEWLNKYSEQTQSLSQQPHCGEVLCYRHHGPHVHQSLPRCLSGDDQKKREYWQFLIRYSFLWTLPLREAFKRKTK